MVIHAGFDAMSSRIKGNLCNMFRIISFNYSLLCAASQRLAPVDSLDILKRIHQQRVADVRKAQGASISASAKPAQKRARDKCALRQSSAAMEASAVLRQCLVGFLRVTY